MDKRLPTRGQLERELSQNIRKLYRQELAHSPRKVTCTLFNNQLTVIIDGAITAIEKTIIDGDNGAEIVKCINSVISKMLKQNLKAIVEEILAVEVEDVLLDSAFKTERTGVLVTLIQSPKTRNSRFTQIKRNREENGFNSGIEPIQNEDYSNLS